MDEDSGSIIAAIFADAQSDMLDDIDDIVVKHVAENLSWWYNSSTDDNDTELPTDIATDLNYWSLVLIVFPLLTVFGNVLVVMSVYREKSLQSVTNYFIVSLAIADIMVATFVMPLSIYVEVNNGVWELGDALCDTYVAFDVMCCTASILNLTAISIDRFIAVTQPLKYAKHKNSRRVFSMLALTWVVSGAISSPIALGMNYTDRRRQSPQVCIFYNSDFIIFSSMGSFYIPCIVMLLLYWRIFSAIRKRARKSLEAKKKASRVDADGHGTAEENRGLNKGLGGGVRKRDINGLHNDDHLLSVGQGNDLTSIDDNSHKDSHVHETPVVDIGGCRIDRKNAMEPVESGNRDLLRIVEDGNISRLFKSGVTTTTTTTSEAETTDNGCTTGTEHLRLLPDKKYPRLVYDRDYREAVSPPVRCSVSFAGLITPEALLTNSTQYKIGNLDPMTTDDSSHEYIQLHRLVDLDPSGANDVIQICPGYHEAVSSDSYLTPAVDDETLYPVSAGGCYRSPTVIWQAGRVVSLNKPNASEATIDKVSNGQKAAAGSLSHNSKCLQQQPQQQQSKVKSIGKLRRANGSDGLQRTIRFDFNLRRKNTTITKEKNSQRRERKATKTLAIVLGIFLLCWVPFFTINIINAICIRYENGNSICDIDPILFSFSVWLGYLNSFLNPAIYTIFNIEFRRAFKKLLTIPHRRDVRY